jgi:anti-anti-sigma factor
MGPEGTQKGAVVEQRGVSVVTVEERTVGHVCLVTLRGRLDRNSAPEVRLELRRTIAGGSGALHVDLAAVDIGDAAGLGVLVEALRHTRRVRRRMHVVAADERTRRLMRRARLGGLLVTVGDDDRMLTGAAG